MVKTVFMFSGQGSQFFQMGAPLYKQNTRFRRAMDGMDAMLRSHVGGSIVTTLYGSASKADPFDDLVLTSASIFALEIALADVLMAAGLMPDLTLGVSLGSYAASVVSGCLDVETAAGLVVQQARVFEQESEAGGMLAVLGDWRWASQNAFLRERSVIAGVYYAKYFVLSARSAHLPEVEGFLRAEGCAFQLLPLRHPFHSPWIEAARPSMQSACDAVAHSMTPARVPVACCATTRCLDVLPPDYFWSAAREVIQFEQTILALESQGVLRYVDVGPSSSLATCLKYLLPKSSASKAYPVVTQFGQDVVNLSVVVRDLGYSCSS